MTYRISETHLEAKVRIVNGMLGFSEDAGYSTPGVVTLHAAYGAWGIHRYANEHGGVSDLSGLGTKRETATFLDGMIQALRCVEDRTNVSA